MEQYYKVVRCYNGRFHSAIVHRFFPSLAIEYKLNEWTTANVGGILVFNDPDAAQRMVHTQYDPYLTIYRCEVAEMVNLPNYGLYADMLDQELLFDLWEGRKRVHSTCLSAWPEHTAAFKRIKLTNLEPLAEI